MSASTASAISAMITAGQRELARVYVMGPGEHLCTPCGDCRQRIREFAASETPVAIAGPGGIREIEFTVQLLQVVRGGQFPEIRTRSTLKALDRLADTLEAHLDIEAILALLR